MCEKKKTRLYSLLVVVEIYVHSHNKLNQNHQQTIIISPLSLSPSLNHHHTKKKKFCYLCKNERFRDASI